jgi:hypothetical protein
VRVGASHADAPGLERLPKGVEHRTLELRKLIEEQYAKVR